MELELLKWARGLIAFSKGVKQSLLEGGKLLKSGLTKEKVLEEILKSGAVVYNTGKNWNFWLDILIGGGKWERQLLPGKKMGRIS